MPERISIIRHAVIVCVIIAGLSANSFADELPPPELPELTLPAIKNLIRQVDSDDFAERISASNDLSVAGAAAVEPLKQLALEGNAESGFRSLKILERLYVRSLILSDEKLALAVEAAFKSIKESDRLNLASRLERMFATHSETNERVAVRRIQQLGGMVSKSVKWVTSRQVQKAFPLRSDEEPKGTMVVIGRKWKGGDEGLKHLERIATLRDVYIATSANVSKDGIERLRLRLLPMQAEVQVRSAARLGVSSDALWGSNECTVNTVSRGSSADKAGMKPGDTIIQFGPDRVGNFLSLVELIKKYDPGETIDAVVIRNGRKVELSIKLQAWGEAPLQ